MDNQRSIISIIFFIIIAIITTQTESKWFGKNMNNESDTGQLQKDNKESKSDLKENKNNDKEKINENITQVNNETIYIENSTNIALNPNNNQINDTINTEVENLDKKSKEWKFKNIFSFNKSHKNKSDEAIGESSTERTKNDTEIEKGVKIGSVGQKANITGGKKKRYKFRLLSTWINGPKATNSTGMKKFAETLYQYTDLGLIDELSHLTGLLLKKVSFEILRLFGKFRIIYKKIYKDSKEELKRFMIFHNNTEQLLKFNENEDNSYVQDINEFSDLKTKEIIQQSTGFVDTEESSNSTDSDDSDELLQVSEEGIKIADSWDWREYQIIAPVKHQGTCGSCWSFSAAAVLESHNMKRLIVEGNFNKNNKIVVSEQNLVDCSKEHGSKGCKGGMPEQGWKYIIKNNGIDTLSSYTYIGQVNNDCQYNESNKANIKIEGTKKLKPGDDDELMRAIYIYGPISVGVHTTQAFTRYRQGIFTDDMCKPDKVNHAVVAVGYGEENGHKYWILRNSWGNKWGEDGYVRLSRNQPNYCGVSQKSYYPIVPGIENTDKVLDKLKKYKISKIEVLDYLKILPIKEVNNLIDNVKYVKNKGKDLIESKIEKIKTQMKA